MDNELLDREFTDLGAPGAQRKRQASPRGRTSASLGDEVAGGPVDALDQYMRAIGDTRILSREETYELARILEAEERKFRRAMFAIPGTALEILGRWEARKRSGYVTAVLAHGYRDGSGRDWGRYIDAKLRKLEKLAGERERLARSQSRRAEARLAALDGEIAKHLLRAGIAFDALLAIHKRFRELLSAPRSRPVMAAKRRLGLNTAPARGHMERARRAVERIDETKQVFVTHNLKLVVKCAKRYRNMGVPYLDLIQEGNLGLIRAVEKFDWRRGFRFSTYAVWWINQALIRVIQNHSRTVRVPSHMYDHQLRYRRVEQELRQRLRRRPTREELGEALELAPEAVDQVTSTMKPIASTQAVVPGTDELTLEDSLADETLPNPIAGIDRLEVRRALERQLRHLPARERQILEWRFGLGGEDIDVTLEQIGRKIGLSRERVRQIEARALRRLREEGKVQRLIASLDLPLPEFEEPTDEESADGVAAPAS